MKYNIFFKHIEETYTTNCNNYMLVLYDEHETSICYVYPNIKEDRYDKLTKPVDMTFFIGHTLEDYLKENDVFSSKIEYKNCVGNPEDYNLYVPLFYKQDDIEYILEKSEEINDKIFEKIKKIQTKFPVVIIGEDYSKREAINSYFYKDIYKYYCTKCKNIFFKENNSYSYSSHHHCPKCNTKFLSDNTIVLKDFKNFRQEQFENKYKYNKQCFNYTASAIKEYSYFMSKHPDDENGIVIYKIRHEIIAEDKKIKEKYIIEYSIEHIVGKLIKSYKYLKKGKKECDSFEVLNINTKNIVSPPKILYDDANDFLEFAVKNEKFLRMSGFQSVLKYSSLNLDLESFFIVFI